MTKVAVLLVIAVGAFLSRGAEVKPPRDFSAAVNLQEGPDLALNAAVGDVDGDGDADIVLARGGHASVKSRVLLNEGQGTFAGADLAETSNLTFAARLTDVDNDGDPDILAGTDLSDRKLVYENAGEGRFVVAGTWGDQWWATRNVSIADLNHDGRPDAIAANRGGPSYVCLNQEGRFDSRQCTAIQGFGAQASATAAVPGDFDGDGTIDVAIPHRDGGASRLYFNDGAGRFPRSSEFGLPSSARTAGAGDLDGDGWVDLAVGDELRGVHAYFNDQKGTLTTGIDVADRSRIPFALAVADMNRDGFPEIVVGYVGRPGSVFFNDGTGRGFEEVRFGDGEGTVFGLTVGDLNGDGYPDIVTARSYAPSTVYFSSARGMASSAVSSRAREAP